MRILVAGQSGQVATALRAIADDDVYITTIGRPALDLAKPETLIHAIQKHQPDVIVNAAAYTAVDNAESDSDAAFSINAAGAGALATAASAAGLPIVHISTDYVFSGQNSTPYQENDATDPLNVYGASKLAGEQLVAQNNPNHIILRTSWVYSLTGKNFLLTMLKLAETRDELNIVADQQGSPTFAGDIAQGIVSIARNVTHTPNDAQLYGVFHMVASGATTWAGFAEKIFDISQKNDGPSAKVSGIKTVDYPTPAKRPQYSVLNTDKLFDVHGVRLPEWGDSVQYTFTNTVSPMAQVD